MKTPYIDKRSKEDLIKYIKDVAPYYTSEWRFNTEDPDMGSVLAIIFTEMFHETIKRLNEVPHKNFVTFLNTIDAKLCSSIPAKGYITLKLVDGVDEGVMVKSREKLSASGSNSERVIFETIKDMYVTPAELQSVYNTNFVNDSIIQSFERNDDENFKEFKLFYPEGENLQKHEFYIKHKNLLNMSQKGKIHIYLKTKSNGKQLDLLNILTNDEIVKWSYKVNENFIDFKKVNSINDYIQIEKDFINENLHNEEKDENNIGIIKCEILDIGKVENLKIDKIFMKSESDNILPDKVYSNDIEVVKSTFYPFEERFSIYNDMHIACNEVFLKKDADVTLKFQLEFKKIPIELVPSEPQIEWKLIMRKSKLKKEPEYEICINEVVWEYWNGLGWSTLVLEDDYKDLFSDINDYAKRNILIKFKCPKDIEETVVNSYKGYFIRIRVLKVNNAYMNKGWYISPIIHNLKLDYKYNIDVLPQQIVCSNNMIEKTYSEQQINDDEEKLTIINSINGENNISYFAFDKKPHESPIKILFSLKSILSENRPPLVWEYYSTEGWKTLSIVDETENMRKTGIVSFLGQDDFTKKKLFNKEMYWIRTYNPSRYYEKKDITCPIINGIYVNTTPIIQNNTVEEELFYIDLYEKNKECKLSRENINNIEVWVNEHGKILEEIEEFLSEDIKVLKNSSGEVEEVWIKWTQVNDFIVSQKMDRHYVVDKNQGIVYFGDGINGKIPTAKNEESIKICYSVGGGENGNLKPLEIRSMTRSLGYINKVFNPLATYGGCDMEKLGEALERSPNILKHRGKAVTAKDYEDLAMEASRNITKAKCFSGINIEGKKEPGAVTLVILQKGDFENELYFRGLKEEVTKYLESRNCNLINKKGKFNVIAPYFIEICVKIDVETSDLDYVFSVKKEIEEKLNKFINPMHGNFDENGWEIGEIPARTQILNCLKNIKNITKINNIIISASVFDKGIKQDIDIEKNTKKIYSIPLNGKHKINISIK